jgi:hypothetical protein
MNDEPAFNHQSLTSLSRQFEQLLSFLRRKEKEWLSSEFKELLGLPEELESRVMTLASSVSELRSQLQNSGHVSLLEWAEHDPASATEASDLISSLREKVQQTRQLAQIQQLLASNLIAFTRGVAKLSEYAQQQTYAGRNNSYQRAQRVEVRG